MEKWWGYQHLNGSIKVKRYYDKQDIQEAIDSDFCRQVCQPFDAESREEAFKHVEDQFYA